MKTKNILIGLGLSLLATTASAVPTTIDIDQTFNSWTNPVVRNGQTVSWTFDYSAAGLTADSIINSASLSITAVGVDGYQDPVVVDGRFLGSLNPGNGISSFDILGIAGASSFLSDGFLTVTLRASEVDMFTDRHSVPYQQSYTDRHPYRVRHSYRVSHWFHTDTRYRYDTHYRTDTHTRTAYRTVTHNHSRSGSLRLLSSNLTISAQNAHSDIPEPSTLLLMLAGFGLVGVRSLKKKA